MKALLNRSHYGMVGTIFEYLLASSLATTVPDTRIYQSHPIQLQSKCIKQKRRDEALQFVYHTFYGSTTAISISPASKFK